MKSIIKISTILCCLMIFPGLLIAQNTTPANTYPDSSQKTGSSFSGSPAVNTIQPSEITRETIMAAEERKKIIEMREKAMSLDSVSADRMRMHADSAMAIWRATYPIQAQTERSKNIMKGAGIVQIISGFAGMLFTIIDATGETKISSYVTYMGNTSKLTVTADNQWYYLHTAMLLLSCGAVVSGIITVNF